MAVLVSTGYAQTILGPTAFDIMFRDGVIRLYAGAQPANADLAPGSSPLAIVTKDGGAFTPGSPTNGLRFTRAGRFVTNDVSQRWVIKGLAPGTAGWFRLSPNVDDGSSSLEIPRIDGVVGLEGDVGDYQMFMANPVLADGLLIDLTQWLYAIPPIGT